MIFNTFSYFLLFLVPSALVFRSVRVEWRAPVIAVTGAAFFIFFSLTAVGGAVGALCLVILLWEAVFSRLYRPASGWCAIGILQAVAVLGVFKYWNFLVDLLPGASPDWRWSGAFLPLGISFFTFEFIHYARDRQLGRTPPGCFWEYMAFILFFPTMVAGPIKRYQDFLPALREPSPAGAGDWEVGITRILSGLAKKFAVADLMTAFTRHLNAGDIAQADRSILPVWLLAYGIQIYVDFSAYSDIAIGSSRLFGIRVKENFDWPVLQSDIAAFWSRWHISLTRWLTDYVFIPLGGSRVSAPRASFNVVATLLVSGLWHGAGLNFLVWGLWHGIALVVHRAWAARFPSGPGPVGPGRRLAGWVLTFVTVQLWWVWFAMDLPTAILFLRRMLLGS